MESGQKNIVFIIGTRPEAIKLAPVVYAFRSNPRFKCIICLTSQHKELLSQVMSFFDIQSDFDFDLMKPDQSLFHITSDALKKMDTVLDKAKADLIIVQGDTTSAFVGALSGFYKKIKVAHAEAGLRSGNKFSPFPEEMNRVLISRLADFHFAPTDRAKENLNHEGADHNVFVVGNTVIDALMLVLDIIKTHRRESEIITFFSSLMPDFVQWLDSEKEKIILLTSHRREHFGKPFENLCYAVKDIAQMREYVKIIYPVHPNPNIRKTAYTILGGNKNIFLIDPLDYPRLVWLMSKSYLVLTDSGGIQEEAPSLGKPVLVLRDVTERTEGIQAGTARLVGTDRKTIVSSVMQLLDDSSLYQTMSHAANPYGDGHASARIVDIIEVRLLANE